MRLIIAASLFLMTGCALKVKDIAYSQDHKSYIDVVTSGPLVFDILKPKSDDAWARAISWINDYSELKIQSVSDYHVSTFDTFVGSGGGMVGPSYTVARSPVRDRTRFTITYSDGWENYRGKEQYASRSIKLEMEAAQINAHILADYIRTGELPFPELIRP